MSELILRRFFERKYKTEVLLAYSALAVFLAYIFYAGSLREFVIFTEVTWLYLFIIPIIFLVDGFKMIKDVYRSKTIQGYEDINKISVVIPTYNGSATIEEVLDSLLEKIPANRIHVVSNGSTDNVVELSEARGVNVYDESGKLGKVRAIEHVLEKVDTEFCLIIDDDTVIDGALIDTSLLENGYDGVAFRIHPANPNQNLITQIQDLEYKMSMDLGKRGANSSGSVECVSGAIGLFNTKELIRQIDHHSKEFDGEDLQRTLLVHLNKKGKGVVCSESIVKTYVPATLKSFLRQRIFSWNPGYYNNFVKIVKVLIYKKTSVEMKYQSYYNVILVTAIDLLRLLLFPVLIFYPGYTIVNYIVYFLIISYSCYKINYRPKWYVMAIMPFFTLTKLVNRYIGFVIFVYRQILINTVDKMNTNSVLSKAFVRISSFIFVFISVISYYYSCYFIFTHLAVVGVY